MSPRMVPCALMPGVSFPASARLFFQVPDKTGSHWMEFDKCLRVDKGPDVLAEMIEDYDGGPITELRCEVRKEGEVIAVMDLTHLLRGKSTGLLDGLKHFAKGLDMPSIAKGVGGFVLGMLASPQAPVDPLAAQKAEAAAVLQRWGLSFPLQREAIELRYRELARKYHPDHGGDQRVFVAVQREKEALLAMAST